MLKTWLCSGNEPSDVIDKYETTTSHVSKPFGKQFYAKMVKAVRHSLPRAYVVIVISVENKLVETLTLPKK